MIFINPADCRTGTQKGFLAKPTRSKKQSGNPLNKTRGVVCNDYPKQLWQRYNLTRQQWLPDKIAALSIDSKDITIFNNFLLSLRYRIDITILKSEGINFL